MEKECLILSDEVIVKVNMMLAIVAVRMVRVGIAIVPQMSSISFHLLIMFALVVTSVSEKRFLKTFTLINYIIVENEDCWGNCGSKGGSCNYCKRENQVGYCCRKDGLGDNGDCPESAMDFISVAHHVCLQGPSGKQCKSTIESILYRPYIMTN